MSRKQVFGLLCVMLTVSLGTIAVASDVAVVEKAKFSPVEAEHATWVFSGIVTNEIGEDFGYFFQLQRDNNHFHANVALLDEASKKVLFHEESEAVMDDVTPYNWRVGRAFLRFNSINDSWIFGVKPKDKLGFNFKVDMLKQFENKPNFHHLRPGVTMMVSQTSELNGHILTGDSDTEQFVRANDAWFRQIWQSGEDDKTHALSSVLCRFNDGSGFYSVNLPEADAQSGSIAGWYTSAGIRQAMSQFIQVSHTKEGAWHIQSQSPRLDLELVDAMQQNTVVAGFVNGIKNPGFCMVNQFPLDAMALK